MEHFLLFIKIGRMLAMAASHIIRLGRVKGKDGILGAMRHNKRTLQNERGAGANIDLARTPLNYSLESFADTPEAIAIHAKVLMVEAGIDMPRKNAVMAVEVIFSLPINWHVQDTRQFFNDCCEWVKKSFPGVLLSFDVHLDEAAPHAHAVILPLVDGKMQGNKMIGGKGNLLRLINLFHAEVAIHYGLSRIDTKHLPLKDKQSIEKQVLARLKGDSVMNSGIWACVRDEIHKDPMPYAQLLGIVVNNPPRKTKKTFVQIMTSKGKGRAYEAQNTI